MPSIAEDELGRLWALVDRLGYDLDPSILIGGWATHLRIGGDISRDIDLIINGPQLRSKLREVLDDYSENTHHSGGRKVRGSVDGIHVDAYIPYESALGDKLRLDVDRLSKYTDREVVKGWWLLNLDAHLATKFAALLDRPDTEKGEKDAREIVGLLREGATASGTVSVLLDATGGDKSRVPGYVQNIFDFLPDRAVLNKRDRRWLADLRREWVDEAERQYRRSQKAGDGEPPGSSRGKTTADSTSGSFAPHARSAPDIRLR